MWFKREVLLGEVDMGILRLAPNVARQPLTNLKIAQSKEVQQC